MIFRVHALKRMFERQISVADVHEVIENGETINTYDDDTPYPSRLILGWIDLRPLHVVCADEPESDNAIIITVYEPDLTLWEPDFKRKRKQ